jgi:hypothetical protein
MTQLLWRFFPLSFLLVIAWILMATEVRANECDATQSPDICQPFVAVKASPLDGGVIIQWTMEDDPPPNAVLIYRQPAGTDGPAPGSSPLLTCPECGVGNFIDKNAQPGVLYRYWVCALWDNNGQVCAPYWEAGLIANPPPPPPPTYPRNLKITESTTWATPTHWTRRWTWSWDGSNQRDYAFVVRQLFSPQVGWNVEGNNLVGYASAFGEDLGVHDRRTGNYRVCAASFHPGGGPVDIKACSNAVAFSAAPVPVPKAPTRNRAAATSRTNIHVYFASGDDDVSEWFDVQRLNGPENNWLTLKPRINAGSAGLLVDDGSRATSGFDNPFTYRVCAGNESGTTCSEPFKAKIADVDVVQQIRLIGLAGKCLNAQSDGQQVPNGTPVTLYACMKGFDGRSLSVQIWLYGRTSAHPLIGVGGKCLDVTGANPRSGTLVELWDCNGGANQNWTFAADGTVRGLAGKCLDVAGGDPGDSTRLILWDCTGAPNQRWRIEDVPR